MTTEETIQLIAKVLAWDEGEPVDQLDKIALKAAYQDSAQQCAEDLGIA